MKTILVFYVNVGSLSPSEVEEYIRNINKSLALNDENTLSFLIPVRTGENRIECLNPILLSEEQYAKTKAQLEEIQKIYEKAL